MYVCYVTYYVTGMAKRTKQQISTNQMGLLQNKIHTPLMDGARHWTFSEGKKSSTQEVWAEGGSWLLKIYLYFYVLKFKKFLHQISHQDFNKYCQSKQILGSQVCII